MIKLNMVLYKPLEIKMTYKLDYSYCKYIDILIFSFLDLNAAISPQ